MPAAGDHPITEAAHDATHKAHGRPVALILARDRSAVQVSGAGWAHPDLGMGSQANEIAVGEVSPAAPATVDGSAGRSR
jgi:hypothetical protein